MENQTKKGKQKIEMKLIESERARTISFSKRKKTLFQDAEKLATRSGEEVGVMLFSPIGKPYSYGSTNIEEIIDKFLKVKLEDCQRDLTEGKSNGFELLENLRKEFQVLNEKEKKRILMYKILHLGSEIPLDKQIEEQKMAIKLQVKNILKKIKSAILVEHLKFDLNVAPEQEEDESS